jgi:hypothetical protein
MPGKEREGTAAPLEGFLLRGRCFLITSSESFPSMIGEDGDPLDVPAPIDEPVPVGFVLTDRLPPETSY